MANSIASGSECNRLRLVARSSGRVGYVGVGDPSDTYGSFGTRDFTSGDLAVMPSITTVIVKPRSKCCCRGKYGSLGKQFMRPRHTRAQNAVLRTHVVYRATPKTGSLIRGLIASASAALLLTQLLAAAESPREHLSLDANWKFHLGDDWPDALHLENSGTGSGPASEKFSDSYWRVVNLPHDWAVELPFDWAADGSHGFKMLGQSIRRTASPGIAARLKCQRQTQASASG